MLNLDDAAQDALLAAIATALAEMDYTQPQNRNSQNFLQAVDELIEGIGSDLGPEFQARKRTLAQQLRTAVSRVSETIRADCGPPP